MKKIVFSLVVGLAFSAFLPATAYSDGCYICSSDSKNACKGSNYCRYSGSDTAKNRKACASKGCKISGTASCPTAANIKICSINAKKAPPVATNFSVK